MTISVGQQVSATQGEWQSNPTSFSYQWQDSADGVSLRGSIAGATRSDYIPVDADIGLYVRCGVTASNTFGASSVVYSAWAGPIGAYVPPGTEPTVLREIVLLSGPTPPPPYPTYYRRRRR